MFKDNLKNIYVSVIKVSLKKNIVDIMKEKK